MISVKGIFGAGLNVRYDNIEVVEVDGLEGDDEFFVLSTKFGVAYRVIGGLGSDTINVAGDVNEDIVTRELEGISGTIDHRLMAVLDKFYDGLPVDGLDYNLATPDLGLVIITETGPGTTVREGGLGSGPIPDIDSYMIRLAADPGSTVYVTISAARSPQEEADDAFDNPEPLDPITGLPSNSLDDGEADSIWLCTGTAATCASQNDFKRYRWINGVLVDEANRALVFTFTGGPGGTWQTDQKVFVYAVDDPRSEGDRVVVVQHSTISENPKFDQVQVRNVEVMVRDNDTPGIYVIQVAPGTSEEDQRSMVIEGGCFNPATDPKPVDNVDNPTCVGLAPKVYTGRTDEILIQLQKNPGTATIRVKLVLDPASQQMIQLDSTDPLGRWNKWVWDDTDTDNPAQWFTYYTIDFDSTNWFTPVRVKINARPDAAWEDPQTAVITFVRDDLQSTNLIVPRLDGTVDIAKSDIDNGKTSDPTSRYVFPNLRSGTGTTAVEVYDDETADAISIESGVGTLVQKCGDTKCNVAYDDPLDASPFSSADWYTIRLTKQPNGQVRLADPHRRHGRRGRDQRRRDPALGVPGHRRARPDASLPREPRDLDRRPDDHARERLRPRQLRRRGLRAPQPDPRHHHRRRDHEDVRPRDLRLADRSHRARDRAEERDPERRGRPRLCRKPEVRHGQPALQRRLVLRGRHLRQHVDERTSEPGRLAGRAHGHPGAAGPGQQAPGLPRRRLPRGPVGRAVRLVRRRRRCTRHDGPLQDRDHPRPQRGEGRRRSSSAPTSTSATRPSRICRRSTSSTTLARSASRTRRRRS